MEDNIWHWITSTTHMQGKKMTLINLERSIRKFNPKEKTYNVQLLKEKKKYTFLYGRHLNRATCWIWRWIPLLRSYCFVANHGISCRHLRHKNQGRIKWVLLSLNLKQTARTRLKTKEWVLRSLSQVCFPENYDYVRKPHMPVILKFGEGVGWKALLKLYSIANRFL